MFCPCIIREGQKKNQRSRSPGLCEKNCCRKLKKKTRNCSKNDLRHHRRHWKLSSHEIIRKCNETRTIRTFLTEDTQNLQKEFDDLVEKINVAEKNPKNRPAVANQNLRTEVKSLEASITERSNLIKDRERERQQLTFHLEQSTKELVSKCS
jgi:chromosome segregation ATPase